MAELTSQDMAALLKADNFQRTGPQATTLSDPIVDTPMVVTLDQLHAYDFNPRLTRNPRYDEIKASIRERGMDAPPSITRRPGEPHYIIRSGGNTRLAILRELWSETRDERFFRLLCIFHPWPERGEIVALTGHLTEGELHSRLTFIERALGVERARELYELELGQAVSQAELARRLSGDGYPIQQPQISRMQDAVLYLLPAIPTLLYGGLGRPQIEKLINLRKAGLRVWEKYAPDQQLNGDFIALFQDVLMGSDTPTLFSIERLQDELVAQMATRLDVGYDALTLEIDVSQNWQHALLNEPQTQRDTVPLIPDSVTPAASLFTDRPPAKGPVPAEPSAAAVMTSTLTQAPAAFTPQDPVDEAPRDRPLQQHVVSEAPTTDRLQSIQYLVAQHAGEVPSADFAQPLFPIQVGGLYPITDVWLIESRLDTPTALRTHIAQFALEIAEEADLSRRIEASEHGIGFRCLPAPPGETPLPSLNGALMTLLEALSAGGQTASSLTSGEKSRLADALPGLLLGDPASELLTSRLSDASVIKLFRLIRLARRLAELLIPSESESQESTLSDF